MGRWWWIGALLVAACDSGGGGNDADDGVTDAGDDDDDDNGTLSEPLECDDEFVACGGDPLGTWEVTGFCSVPIEGVDCDDLVVTILSDRSTGTVGIRDDGTYDRTYNVDVDMEAAFPLSCIAPIPCALIPPASGGLISSCSDDGTTCTCQGSYAETDSASGNWVMDGNNLVADGDPWAICVTGDQATVEEENGNRVHWQR